MTHSSVLIAALTGRALAASARRAGFEPLVVDAFGDEDARASAGGFTHLGEVTRTGFRARPLLAAMTRLDVSPEPALMDAVTDGLGADPAGEDRFDCLLGVLCVINVLAGHRPDTTPADPWLTTWEGWVLGQTAMPVLV